MSKKPRHRSAYPPGQPYKPPPGPPASLSAKEPDNRRNAARMLFHLADCLYWMARYIKSLKRSPDVDDDDELSCPAAQANSNLMAGLRAAQSICKDLATAALNSPKTGASTHIAASYFRYPLLGGLPSTWHRFFRDIAEMVSVQREGYCVLHQTFFEMTVQNTFGLHSMKLYVESDCDWVSNLSGMECEELV